MLFMEQSRLNFNFLKDSETDMKYKPDNKLHKFHQICMFRDPNTKKYNVRTVIFDDLQEIIKVTDKNYNSEQCKSLIALCKGNDYKIYQTFDLALVDYPDSDDLLKTKSDLLGDTQGINNYAKF